MPVLSLNGGIRVIATLAERLRQRGHEVLVVSVPTWEYYVPIRSRIRSVLAGRGLPKRTPPHGPSHFDGLPITRHVLDRRRPVEDRDVPDADLVIATWWETAEWVSRLSPAKGVKVNFIQQFDANFDQPLDRVEATWRLPMHKIVCSDWLADLARDRFDDPHATVVPNGIDTDLFNAPPRGKRPRPTVGVMYSTLTAKCFGIALATLIEASRRVPGLHIRAFGSDVPRSYLPLPDGAEYEVQPSQHRIREIYAECDVWLCSSGSEGFHLPPHEAMACRCPVVSTRVGGPIELVDEGINGHLVEPFDACTLADRLVDVLGLPESEWLRMSEAAYAKSRRFTWEEAADRFERGLNLAIERAARGEIAGVAAEALT